MERALDKSVLLALGAFMAAMLPSSTTQVIAALLAVSVAALFDVDTLPRALRAGSLLGYVAASLAYVDFVAFLPLIAYDCFRLDGILDGLSSETRAVLKAIWAAPLLPALASLPPLPVLLLALLGGLACMMAWHGQRLGTTLDGYRGRRDELMSLSRSLEQKNRDLEERQSLELRLATLAERSRIAREIHDNVGHLLTRSVLQVEAMQVLHGADPDLAADLANVASGLREAYESVRLSVHGLHEEAFDLHSQLKALALETEGLSRLPGRAQAGTAQPGDVGQPLRIALDYGLGETAPSPAVSHSLLSIAKEALANSIRHSDASLVKVSLKEFPGFYQMTVHDNGSQAPAAGSRPSGGIGLANMEERARVLGGVLYASYDAGFRVFVSIPKEA
jgi:signal transduction histidine kinase